MKIKSLKEWKDIFFKNNKNKKDIAKRKLLIIEVEIDTKDKNLFNELMNVDIAISRAGDEYVVLKDKTYTLDKKISLREANKMINSGNYMIILEDL